MLQINIIAKTRTLTVEETIETIGELIIYSHKPNATTKYLTIFFNITYYIE